MSITPVTGLFHKVNITQLHHPPSEYYTSHRSITQSEYYTTSPPTKWVLDQSQVYYTKWILHNYTTHQMSIRPVTGLLHKVNITQLHHPPSEYYTSHRSITQSEYYTTTPPTKWVLGQSQVYYTKWILHNYTTHQVSIRQLHHPPSEY